AAEHPRHEAHRPAEPNRKNLIGIARAPLSGGRRAMEASSQPAGHRPDLTRSTLEPELLPQQLVDDLWVGLAARRPHHLTHEPTEQGGLGLDSRYLVGMAGNHGSDGLIDDGAICDLAQAALLNDLRRVAALAPDRIEHILGDLAGDGARGDEIDDGAQLRGR